MVDVVKMERARGPKLNVKRRLREIWGVLELTKYLEILKGYILSQQTRLLVGLVVLLGGLFVLARGYFSTRPVHGAEVLTAEVSETVQSALDPTNFTVVPTTDLMPDIIEQIKASVIEQCKEKHSIAQLGPTGIGDLGEAFAERLRFLTIPNLDRDFQASSSRGDPLDREQWFDRYRVYEQSIQDQKTIPAMNPAGVQVSVLSLAQGDIDSEKANRLGQGFGVTLGTRGDRLPVPEDPIQEGLVVVEVVLPMMRLDMITRKMATAILGYRFAWNSRMQKWIPYQSVIYKNPNSAFSPPLL